MKCCVLHFIWVFTVCQKAIYGVSGIQQVKCDIPNSCVLAHLSKQAKFIEFYLSVQTGTLFNTGYSIFIVTGSLTECEADQLLSLIPAVQPIKPQLIADASGTKVRSTGETATGNQDDDLQLKKAMKESKDLNENDDKSLQRVLQMSMEGGYSIYFLHRAT